MPREGGQNPTPELSCECEEGEGDSLGREPASPSVAPPPSVSCLHLCMSIAELAGILSKCSSALAGLGWDPSI